MRRNQLQKASLLAAKGVPPGHLKALTEELYEQVTEIVICERFHWTLDYVRGLGADDYMQVRAVVSGLNEAREQSG